MRAAPSAQRARRHRVVRSPSAISGRPRDRAWTPWCPRLAAARNGRRSGNASDLGPMPSATCGPYPGADGPPTMVGACPPLPRPAPRRAAPVRRRWSPSLTRPPPLTRRPRQRPLARRSGHRAAGWRIRWHAVRSTSLAQRFLLANLLILLVAGLTVGVWVGDQLERSIVDRTASVTALYVESIIEPSVASLADGSESEPGGDRDARRVPVPPARSRSAFARCASGRRTAASSTAPVTSSSAGSSRSRATWPAAWPGEVMAGMDDLSGEENAWERARWSSPSRDVHPGPRARQRPHHRRGRVLPAAAARSTSRSHDARLTTWLLVTLAIVAVGRAALRHRQARQRHHPAPGGGPHPTGGRADRAARGERRAQRARPLGSGAHHDAERTDDAPGQLRPPRRPGADALAGHPAPRRTAHARGRPDDPPTAAELAEVEEALREAMTDMRSVAAGLRVPELASLDVGAVAARAVRDHERRSGAQRHARAWTAAPAARLAAGQDRAVPGTPGGRSPTPLATAAARPSACRSPPAPRDRPSQAARSAARRERRRRRLRPGGAGNDGEVSAWPASGSRPRSWVVRSPSARRPQAGTQLRVWWPVQGHEEEA